MSEYGVQPTGFVRKPLTAILNEIEASMVTEFGPGVVQTSVSPLGQLNGLMADIITELWEIAEDVYQSYDPDQAEGTRLETLARVRLMERAADEDDVEFRQAITNSATARVSFADFIRAVKNVKDVYYAQVFVNETPTNNSYQMPPNTISVAVLGGEGADIAQVVNQYATPGISTYGNQEVNAMEEGLCRSLWIVRPVETETELNIQVKMSPDRKGCPAPSPITVAEKLAEYLTGSETRPWNGQDIDPYFIRSFVESNFSGVQYVNTIGFKGTDENPYYTVVPFEFLEIAKVTSVTVEVVE